MSRTGALIAYDLIRQTADICQATAVAWLVATATGSALAVAGVWALNLLPWLALPLFGTLADRLPRRAIIRVADGTVIVLALAIALGGHLPTGVAFAWTAAYATLAAVARPAVKGLIREVGRDAASLLARMTALEYLVLGGGQFLAAALLLRGSPAPAFLAMAVLLGVGLLALSRTGSAEPAEEPRWGPVLRQLAEPSFRRLFLVTIGCGACAFTVRALAPLLVTRNLHASVLGFAGLGAAYSLGAAVGAARFRGRTALRWLPAAAAVLVAGTTGSLALAVLSFAAIGIAAGSQDAANSARVAAELPAGAQSRGMAVTSLVWRIPGLLAGALAGLSALVGVGWLVGGLAAIAGLTAIWAAAAPPTTGSAASASG
jgi:hypothetical protein